MISQRPILSPEQLEAMFHQCGPHRERLRQDVYSLLHYTPSLLPKDSLDGNIDGRQRTTLILEGTIPITYRGGLYHIPINLFVTNGYPVAPPIAYVIPTKDMMIKPKHRCVDGTGLVHLPYNSQWRPDTCHLIGLTEALMVAFSMEPPVFAKPKEQQEPPPPYVAPSKPPSYHDHIKRQEIHTPSPPTTPHPSEAGPPIPITGNGVHPIHPSHPPPPHPSTVTPPLLNGPMPVYHSVPQSPPPIPQSPPPIPQSPPGIVESESSGRETPVKSVEVTNDKSILNETVPEVLDTAQEEAPGDRPHLLSTLNQLVQENLRFFTTQSTDMLNSFYVTESQLENNAKIIDQVVESFELESKMLDENLSILSDTEIEIDNWLAQHENVNFDVDQIVLPNDGLSQNMLELASEDASLDDCMYYLSEGLNEGLITAEEFLKVHRRLARQQFMHRAMMLKIWDLQSK